MGLGTAIFYSSAKSNFSYFLYNLVFFSSIPISPYRCFAKMWGQIFLPPTIYKKKCSHKLAKSGYKMAVLQFCGGDADRVGAVSRLGSVFPARGLGYYAARGQ